MTKIFAHQDRRYGDSVVFTVPDGYAMQAAAEILKKIELEPDCDIRDASWKSSGYGKLVEHGIRMRLGTIEFDVMCSYGDIFLSRKSGNKEKFLEFCERVRNMDIESAA